MNISTAVLCKPGGRKDNDDAVQLLDTPEGIRVYVGDGLGFYAGGRQASETAGRILLEYPGDLLSEEKLYAAAGAAAVAVKTLQEETGGSMKTTAVFLNISGNQSRWMHIGDSRLYCFFQGKLVHQTVDHSLSQMAVMMGRISTHEIRFHPDRNTLFCTLGGAVAKPEISPVKDLSVGKYAFLLCTDGFWEYVYEPEMEAALESAADPQDWLDRMEEILLARIPENNDNYSAAAVFADSGNPVCPEEGRELSSGGFFRKLFRRRRG